MPPRDDGDAENFERLKAAEGADLGRGASSVEGVSPEEEAAHDRKDGLHLKRTIRQAKQAATWMVVAAFAVFMGVLIFAFCQLVAAHIKSVLADPAKVSDLLEDSVGWILVALSSLFIDRHLRGDK